MASSSLRLGVIGVGFGATVQIPGFQSEGVEVTAVCARRRERAKEAAARFHIPGVYDDYHEMLREATLDAVSVVSPIPLHHPMTMAAMDAGKHVLVEKPMATSLEDCDRMISATRSLKPGRIA